MTEIVTKEMEAFRKKLDELGVTLVITHAGLDLGRGVPDRRSWPHDAWRGVLRRPGGTLDVTYKTGLGHRKPAPGMKVVRTGIYDEITTPSGSDHVSFGKSYRTEFYGTVDGATYAALKGFTVPVPPSREYVLAAQLSDAASVVDHDTFADWVNNICDGNRTVENLNTYLTCQEQLRGVA